MRMLTRVKKVSLTLQSHNPGCNVRSELKMSDRGCKWTDEEIKAFLAICSNATIQRQLLGTTRNTAVFRNIKTRCKFHAQKLKRCLADTKVSFEFVCIPAPDAFIEETLIPALCPSRPVVAVIIAARKKARSAS